jgi:hypothetical protein
MALSPASVPYLALSAAQSVIPEDVTGHIRFVPLAYPDKTAHPETDEHILVFVIGGHAVPPF